MNDPALAGMEPSRRTVLAALAGVLAGCHTPTPLAAPLCPRDPAISDLAAPLTIDTHAHFFNGRDLQIRNFLSKAVVGQDSELFGLVDSAGTLLQALAWHRAPDAAAELAALAHTSETMGRCDAGDLRRAATPAYQEGYAVGRQQLRDAALALSRDAEAAAVLGPGAGDPGIGALISDLPPTFDEFEARRADTADILGSHPTLGGTMQFILHHFNHRHVNAIDYLQTYSSRSARKIDLVVASLVDYDWWLAQGRPTATSLDEQVDLTGRMSVLLGGRVHGFVAFCPFREAMTRGADGIGESLRRVQHAVQTQGFIGVKLYPPMGFAAQGNAARRVWQNKPGLPDAARDPGFGQRLDDAMAALFRWCVEHDVPVMAHTNHSNGPFDDFKDLAGSEGWQLALQRFPGLAVNFGHFGDCDLEDHQGEPTRKFLALMSGNPGAAGSRAFADSGYFAGTLMNQIKMRDALTALYDAPPALLRERLMYGSDWTMILTQKNVERYLADFIEVIDRIQSRDPARRVRGKTLADAFFGANAADFLGLRARRGNRVRLEAFYARHQIPTPDWMRKVDVDA